MVGLNPTRSREAMAQELVSRATEVWGRERVEATRKVLDEMAGYLWVVAENLPDREEEPAFFS